MAPAGKSHRMSGHWLQGEEHQVPEGRERSLSAFLGAKCGMHHQLEGLQLIHQARRMHGAEGLLPAELFQMSCKGQSISVHQALKIPLRLSWQGQKCWGWYPAVPVVPEIGVEFNR